MDETLGFGPSLRSAREQRGISLERISATTKVSVRYLMALESGRFDELPGGILNKGMVRGYARCLGLDEAEWVDHYVHAHPAQDPFRDTQGWATFARNVSSQRAPSRRGLSLRWVGVCAMLVVLSAFGVFVWGHLHARASNAAQSPAASAPYAASTQSNGTGTP